jgi:hypothetical protein
MNANTVAVWGTFEINGVIIVPDSGFWNSAKNFPYTVLYMTICPPPCRRYACYYNETTERRPMDRPFPRLPHAITFFPPVYFPNSHSVFELFCLEECWYCSLLITSVWGYLSLTTYRTLMEYNSWQRGTSLKQRHPCYPWGLHSVASARQQ